jgi:hypothetical protein
VSLPSPLARLAADLLADDLAAVSGADLAELVLVLKMEEAGYQAVMGATARLSLPSLADFLG